MRRGSELVSIWRRGLFSRFLLPWTLSLLIYRTFSVVEKHQLNICETYGAQSSVRLDAGDNALYQNTQTNRSRMGVDWIDFCNQSTTFRICEASALVTLSYNVSCLSLNFFNSWQSGL